MQDTIKNLLKEKATLIARVKKIDAAIFAFQDVCTHQFPNGDTAEENCGHDSHKDHYKCKICGRVDLV